MRQYIRHPSEMPIHYRINELSRKKGRQKQKLHDISSGGLSFQSARQIELGSSVHIEIEVRPPPFVADGVVVWCEKDNGGYQVGLQFNDADVEYSLRMIEQLCYIEQYKNEIQAKEGRRLNSEQAAKEWISQFASDFPH